MLPTTVHHSATVIFHAPSDLAGTGGMRREQIRCTRSWRKGAARHDCIYVEQEPDLEGFRGLFAARVKLLFRFKYQEVWFPCMLVEWFSTVGNEPDELTGMWVVEPDYAGNGRRSCSVIHVDSVLRNAHLIPAYGSAFIPHDLTLDDSLDAFNAFYVNKYADHHSYEIVF